MKGISFTNLADRIRSFKKWWTRERIILLLIFCAGTIIRSIPGWMNAAWGSDFGIYYGITKDFAENPQLFRPYTGWGVSYNYFPVLYIMVASLHRITGLSIVWLLPRITPIFGGLAVMVFYFVVKEIFNDRRLALISTAFLAVNPFHIYQTSHAAPMTMGHFLMILCILLFLKKGKSTKLLVALYSCSILLVASHHLTTFFYLITISFILFYRNFISKSWTEEARGDIVYILFFSSFTFLYWMLIATPVYSGLRSGLLIPSWAVIVLFFIVLGMLLVLVEMRRRFDIFPEKSQRIKLGLWQSILVSLSVCSLFVIIFSFISIPRTGFRFQKTAVIFLLPTIIAVGFGIHGAFIMNNDKHKGYVFGWAIPIFISLLFTTLTWHKTLFPFRHLEYIAYPLSILSGVGVYRYWQNLRERDSKKDTGSGLRKGITRKTFTYIVVIILGLNLISAYAVQRTTSGYEESISDEVFLVIDWMRGNVTGYNFTVASDHRISQILWAEGYNATSDAAYEIWFSDNWIDCLSELSTANGTGPVITYVLIDDVMLFQGVQSNINETPRPLTVESYGKFQDPPFLLLFRSENEDKSKWVELYEVDWGYIQDNYP